jgi:hypothetical protein
MSKKPIERDAPEADEAAPAPGWHHGLSPEQIKKIEDARYDDTEGVPPPELPPVEEPPIEEPPDAKAKAKAEKEHEAEAEKKRGKHG